MSSLGITHCKKGNLIGRARLVEKFDWHSSASSKICFAQRSAIVVDELRQSYYDWRSSVKRLKLWHSSASIGMAMTEWNVAR